MSDYNITYSIYLHWLRSEEKAWLEERILEGDGGGTDWEFDEEGVHLYSANGGFGREVELLQEFLRKFRPDGMITIPYAVTNTRMVPQGFGGGALAITRHGVDRFDATGWVAQKARQHQAQLSASKVNGRRIAFREYYPLREMLNWLDMKNGVMNYGIDRAWEKFGKANPELHDEMLGSGEYNVIAELEGNDLEQAGIFVTIFDTSSSNEE